VQQRSGRSGASGADVLVALADLGFDSRVAQFEVILQFIGIHNADYGHTVLLRNEIRIVEVGTLGQLAKIYRALVIGKRLSTAGDGFVTGLLD
jgi:hypothetical protein